MGGCGELVEEGPRVGGDAHAIRKVAGHQPAAWVRRQVCEAPLVDRDLHAGASGVLRRRGDRSGVLVGSLDAGWKPALLLPGGD